MHTTKIFARAMNRNRESNVTSAYASYKVAVAGLQLDALANKRPDVEIKPITFAYVRATDETCLMEAK